MLTVRESRPGDAAAIATLHDSAWGGPVVVGHDTAYDLSTLPTLVAVSERGELAGALAYSIGDDSLEVVSIVAGTAGQGIGTALLDAAVGLTRERQLRRIWLVTTNDNLDALRFYQRRGLRIVGVSQGAVDRSRMIKHAIPETGAYGIPLRDELTLELLLAP